MKKTIFIIAFLVCALVSFTSCNSCKNEKEAEKAEAELILENTVSLDRETVYAQYSKDYCWYESQVIMKDLLDGDTDGTIESIVNVFQTFGENGDPTVIRFKHTVDTTIVMVDPGYWLEDLVLDDRPINLTFKEAFDRVLASDAIKPHSKCCTLRRELGPKYLENPQYIFGNVKAQLYVDAVTGDVTDKDPAFDGFEKPKQ